MAGRLAPQPRVAGVLADDAAGGGFYIFARDRFDAPIPVFTEARDWLAQNGVFAVLVRPDGYVFSAAGERMEIDALLNDAAPFPVDLATV